MSSSPVALLILAAGASSRMGQIKQLLPWKGTTLLGNAITQGLASKAASVSVVLGANAADIAKKQDLRAVNKYINSDWKKGLGTSIAFGVRQLLNENKNIEAILIALADQPFVDRHHLDKLIDGYQKQEKGIIATSYKDDIGVPALFAKVYFDSLLELKSDSGAKGIMYDHIRDVSKVNGSDIIKDLDTYEEYLMAIRL